VCMIFRKTKRKGANLKKNVGLWHLAFEIQQRFCTTRIQTIQLCKSSDHHDVSKPYSNNRYDALVCLSTLWRLSSKTVKFSFFFFFSLSCSPHFGSTNDLSKKLVHSCCHRRVFSCPRYCFHKLNFRIRCGTTTFFKRGNSRMNQTSSYF